MRHSGTPVASFFDNVPLSWPFSSLYETARGVIPRAKAASLTVIVLNRAPLYPSTICRIWKPLPRLHYTALGAKNKRPISLKVRATDASSRRLETLLTTTGKKSSALETDQEAIPRC